eukprot:3917637-Ditylum_brightwellii.AAC.1
MKCQKIGMAPDIAASQLNGIMSTTVDLSIPGYIADMLHKFQHEQPNYLQHSPYQHVIPNYSSKVQLIMAPDTLDPLNKIGIKRIQAIIGMLLYYARQ